MLCCLLLPGGLSCASGHMCSSFLLSKMFPSFSEDTDEPL